MTPDERERLRVRDELELHPGAPITVAVPSEWTMSALHVDGLLKTVLCIHERVLHVDDKMIHYGETLSGSVRREDEGKTWARGWDTKDAQAFEAQLILQQSA